MDINIRIIFTNSYFRTFNFRERINRTLNRVELENCSADVCLGLLRKPTLQLLSALNKKLKTCEKLWITDFLEVNGLDVSRSNLFTPACGWIRFEPDGNITRRSCNTEKFILFKIFLIILKRMLQNYWKVLKRYCFVIHNNKWVDHKWMTM